MKSKIRFLALLMLSLISMSKIYAQADINMSTHWYNRANYNPATITRPDYIYIFSNVRGQWGAVKGAPKVINLQVSQYISNLNSAFGLSFVSDQIGFTKTLNPMLTYAYLLTGNQDWSLSFGLSGGVFSRQVDRQLYDPENITDPLLFSSLETSLYPDANVGVEFETHNYIFGISSTHLFSIANPNSLFINTNHRYLYAIYKNTNLNMFNYNLGLQVVNRNNLTVLEMNGSVRFKHQTGLSSGPREMIDIGLTYRTSNQLTIMFGANLSSNFKVGFAYEKSFFPGYFQNSTNEIILEYRIPSKTSSTCAHCLIQKDWYN